MRVKPTLLTEKFAWCQVYTLDRSVWYFPIIGFSFWSEYPGFFTPLAPGTIRKELSFGQKRISEDSLVIQNQPRKGKVDQNTRSTCNLYQIMYKEMGRKRRLKETSWGGSREIREKKGGSTGKGPGFFVLPMPFQVCIL